MPNLYNLTADLGDLLGGDAIAATARGRVETNLRSEALIDTGTGGQIRLGNAPVTINADGTLLVEGLVGSDSTDLNIEPGTLQYQLTIEYRDPAIQGRAADRTYRSGWFFLNATSDVATVAKTVTPAVAQSGADIIAAAAFEADRAEAAVVEAQAARDEAAVITGLTGEDDAVALLVNTPTSDTASALSTTIGRGQPGGTAPLDETGKVPSGNLPPGLGGGGSKATARFPLNIPTYDGDPSVGHPDVVRVPGGWNGYEYWMAFTPFPSTSRENPCIVASNDGVNWVVPTGLTNPIHPLATATAMGYEYWADTDMVLSPDGTTLILFFKGTHGPNGINEYVRSTSTNGITWTAPTVVVPDADLAGTSPAVIVEDDGTFTMFDVFDVIQRRTSTDLGVTWTARTATTTPALDAPYTIWHLDVTKDADGAYHALVAGSTTTGTVPHRLFHWTSADGLAWTGDTAAPSVPITGSYLDRWGHYRSCLLPAASGVDGLFDVWITMMDDTRSNHNAAIWRLGHIKDFDFSNGETWTFPLAPEARPLVDNDERWVMADQLMTLAGTANISRVPNSLGGFPAKGLSHTAGATIGAVFAPLPSAWTYFAVEALVVNAGTLAGDVYLTTKHSVLGEGDTLNAGVFKAPGVRTMGAQNVPKWIDLVQYPTFDPVFNRQGRPFQIQIDRGYGNASDTFDDTMWILAVRLRRVRDAT